MVKRAKASPKKWSTMDLDEQLRLGKQAWERNTKRKLRALERKKKQQEEEELFLREQCLKELNAA